MVELDLSSFADKAPGNTAQAELRYPLTKSFINGAYIDVTIFPKLMSTEASDMEDDTMSMQSGFSDAPVMSADFDSDVSMSSLPTYPAASMTPEKVPEEEEEQEEEDLSLQLHNKKLELENLRDDFMQLTLDHTQCQQELAAAQASLSQMQTHVQTQLEDRIGESESARASRVTLTRILAATNLTPDEDIIANLKEEAAALLAELEAQRNVQSAYTQALQVKQTRLTEAEARNLHLLGKVNQLADKNIALKKQLEQKERDEQFPKTEKDYRSRIMDLMSTKDHTESELQRQIEVNNDLKRRLQLYSENIAELEVNGLTRRGNTAPSGSSSPVAASPAGGLSASERATPDRRGSTRKDSAAVVESVTYEGSLTKRGSFYPSWKKRHFVLHGDAHLSYYTNEEEMVFKGHFIIGKDTVLGEATVSGYSCFYLQHSKRRLYMTAATPLEQMEWVTVFRRCIAALNDSNR
jgi:hypothetical protein